VRHSTIAALETDLAQVARASDRLEVLEVLAIRALQGGMLDTEEAERVFEALARVDAGIQVSRKWLGMLRHEGGVMLE
jgi:hypothetical protein